MVTNSKPNTDPLIDTNQAEESLLLEHFLRGLSAQKKSPRTIESYKEAVVLLARFLSESGMPTELPCIRREHVESFIVDILTRYTPGTAANRYRSLQQYFKWCVEEGEIRESPMRNMKPPKLHEVVVPVITEADITALLRACEGRDFEHRRDTAIVRILLDCGLRRSEMASLRIGDVDWKMNTLKVLGKGNKQRLVPFAHKAARDLDRYLRVRERHPQRDSDYLWLGSRGPLTDSGIVQCVERRTEEAGLPHIHLHQFRHSTAHYYLDAGGQETDLMRIMGWASRTMVARYAASVGQQRAIKAHEKLSPGDRF